MVRRRGQRRADQRSVRHRQRSERRQRAVELDSISKAGCSIWSAAGAPTRTAACATTFSTTSRASGTRTHRDVHPTGATMDEIKNKMIDYAGKIKAIDPVGARRRPRGVGLERLLLQRLRSAVRQLCTAGASCPIAAITAAGLFALAARSVAAEQQCHGQTAAGCLHGALLSAGRRIQQRHFQRHATAAQPLDPLALGSRATSTKPGSTIAFS